ncbi:P-loop containing nucleoside triphosphate hydrolase protein, partial [Ascodesmis nigricans]
MPAATAKPRCKRSSLSKARQQLRGVLREDSDDELGYDDIPWEWVHDPTSLDDDGAPLIIGARFGSFEARIGDILLIKGEGLKGEAYVGLACHFFESDEGEMNCSVLWFSTESEITKKTKKRMDFLENELYLNPNWDDVPLPSINGRATVCSLKEFEKRWPNGVTKKEKGKVFVCRRGCNPRTAVYTDEFVWEDKWKGRDTDTQELQEWVEQETTAKRKKETTKKRGTGAMNTPSDEEDTYGKPPQTPSRKRQRSATVTPSRRKLTSAFSTPQHQRITVKAPLLFTPLHTRVLSPQKHLSTPYALARHRLHVSTLPPTLPCREAEFLEVHTHLSAAITAGTGSCIYISGTPGTGKTATVREVITQLQALVQADDLDDFTFLEINGMKITDPHQSYSLLWESLKNERVSPSQALSLLEREFSTPSPRRVPCVVLMDELDQLVTRGQGVMYNFFNWPSMRHSRLIVLAVANTMDLPERTLSNKISSRLGLTRITFPGYTHQQLQTIITSRLSGIPGNIVLPDAIQFAARKVAAVSGDARRALDICRRAVELVEPLGPNDATATPSRRKAAEEGKVTIQIIKKAINESTSSPLQVALRNLPTAAKVFLAALLARMRRSGVAENALSEVWEEAER